jgi:hypothetical protein
LGFLGERLALAFTLNHVRVILGELAMIKVIVSALLLVVISLPARADYVGRIIGRWMVSATEDRFGDGGTFVAATQSSSYVLAVRCIQKTLSIGHVDGGDDPKPFRAGDLFVLKFRIDKQPVTEVNGVAISERLIQVVTEKSLVKSMRDGAETAMKLESDGGVSSMHIFKMAGAPKAFADLSKECPID